MPQVLDGTKQETVQPLQDADTCLAPVVIPARSIIRPCKTADLLRKWLLKYRDTPALRFTAQIYVDADAPVLDEVDGAYSGLYYGVAVSGMAGSVSALLRRGVSVDDASREDWLAQIAMRYIERAVYAGCTIVTTSLDGLLCYADPEPPVSGASSQEVRSELYSCADQAVANDSLLDLGGFIAAARSGHDPDSVSMSLREMYDMVAEQGVERSVFTWSDVFNLPELSRYTESYDPETDIIVGRAVSLAFQEVLRG